MSGLGLALILAAAGLHATWNFLIKRAGQGAAFMWVVSAVATVVYAAPTLGLVLYQPPHIGGLGLLFITASALIHVGYYLTLQTGFRVGDFSLVYPIARGTGPVLTTIFAVLLLGERPSLLALGGIALVTAGAFVLGGGGVRSAPASRKAIGFGLLTGLFIASYTLVDKYSVSVLLVPPLLLDWASHALRVVILLPWALADREGVRRAWQAHRLEAVGVGVLSPLAYILVLTAMIFTPVSYVAPAREVSILIGAVMGAKLLAEGHVVRRLCGAGAIVAGVLALALG